MGDAASMARIAAGHLGRDTVTAIIAQPGGQGQRGKSLIRETIPLDREDRDRYLAA